MEAKATPTAAPDASAEERAALGKAARRGAPRSGNAAWEPAAGRADPVGILEAQAATRVPELVPLRYGRMLASPFAFFRGAAAVMAADLATTPSSGLTVQACGDAHLANFGIYAAPDRRLVVDVNDFDETLPAPWEWDLKRLAASFEIAGRDRGFGKGRRRELTLGAARAYRSAMRRFAAVSNLDVWYWRVDVDAIRERYSDAVSSSDRKLFERNLSKTRRKDRLRALSKLTVSEAGELRIRSDPPTLVPLGELMAGAEREQVWRVLQRSFEQYRESLAPDHRHLLDGYRFIDAARKVVGVGSVGTRAWIMLLRGRDGSDPLFLQAKEAQASVLEAHTAPSEYTHQGRRVVEGQRLTQAASDILLGWNSSEDADGVVRDYYVRQLWDQKGSAAIETMSPTAMAIYAEICGTILARAHARSGDRVAIAGYLGGGSSIERAMAEFASAYADQNERDHAALAAAAREGRVSVETEAGS